MITYALSFAAGSLTTLSPCVLPALPLIVGGATQKNRTGPLWIAAGLIFSFVVLGTALAILAPAIGLEPESIRAAAAILLVLAGVVLMVPPAQALFQKWMGPFANRAASRLPGEATRPSSQFFLGALLGAVWSPCVGPTLGAAVGLAAQTSTFLSGVGMMLAFGIGSALPLLGVAYASRSFFLKSRTGLAKFAERGKPIMGGFLAALGVSILMGWDKRLEALLLGALPEGWLEFITRL